MERSTLRRLRSWPTLVGLVAATALTVTACGSSDDSGDSASAGTQTQSLKEINVKPTGPAAVKVGTNCGDTVPVGPKNKEGAAFQSMSDRLKDVYGS
jgi:hypothetical protein